MMGRAMGGGAVMGGRGPYAMFVSPDHLEFLRLTCTNLEWLVIDIPRIALAIVNDQEDTESYENSQTRSVVLKSTSPSTATHVNSSTEAGTLNIPKRKEKKIRNAFQDAIPPSASDLAEL